MLFPQYKYGVRRAFVADTNEQRSAISRRTLLKIHWIFHKTMHVDMSGPPVSFLLSGGVAHALGANINNAAYVGEIRLEGMCV